MKRLMVIAGLTVAASVTVFGGFEVDGRVPAGNIVVEAVEGDTVRLTRELRDTAKDWFYRAPLDSLWRNGTAAQAYRLWEMNAK